MRVTLLVLTLVSAFAENAGADDRQIESSIRGRIEAEQKTLQERAQRELIAHRFVWIAVIRGGTKDDQRLHRELALNKQQINSLRRLMSHGRHPIPPNDPLDRQALRDYRDRLELFQTEKVDIAHKQILTPDQVQRLEQLRRQELFFPHANLRALETNYEFRTELGLTTNQIKGIRLESDAEIPKLDKALKKLRRQSLDVITEQGLSDSQRMDFGKMLDKPFPKFIDFAGFPNNLSRSPAVLTQSEAVKHRELVWFVLMHRDIKTMNWESMSIYLRRNGLRS